MQLRKPSWRGPGDEVKFPHCGDSYLLSHLLPIFIFGPSSSLLAVGHTPDCGIEFCVRCVNNQCSSCLFGSERHDGECVAGELVTHEGKKKEITHHNCIL